MNGWMNEWMEMGENKNPKIKTFTKYFKIHKHLSQSRPKKEPTLSLACGSFGVLVDVDFNVGSSKFHPQSEY